MNGVCDKVRGDGDNHMRGMGCLLTGVELFPGNIQGGSDTPAGWSSGISMESSPILSSSRPGMTVRFTGQHSNPKLFLRILGTIRARIRRLPFPT